MHAANRHVRARETRRELIALLLAGVACAVMLTAALAGGTSAGVFGIQLSSLVISILLAGSIATSIAVVGAIATRTRRAIAEARAETATLRHRLTMAEATMKAEPQTLIYWAQGEGLRVAIHSLDPATGVPAGHEQLLRFGGWLEPASADELKTSLDTLFTKATPFNIFLRTTVGRHIEADGRTAGTRAILRLRDVAGYKSDLVRIIDMNRQLNADLRATRGLLEQLPIAVWFRGPDQRLQWVNPAYAKAVEAADTGEVLNGQIELLDSRQRAAVAAQLTADKTARTTLQSRIQLTAGGARKTHDVIVVPLDDTVAAAAIDVAALETAQGDLDRHMMAYDRTLDHVSTAVGVFGKDHRLTFYNEAYRKLWDLDPAWLDRGPYHGEILDRLRDMGRLPPVADYRRWKGTLLGDYKSSGHDEWWQLPGGRMLQVFADQQPDGGVTWLYDDATERLALESRYNALIQVQRETIDSLTEGVAVFSTDGRVQLFNTAFARIWRLSGSWLGRGPHIDTIVASLTEKFDDDSGLWQRLTQAVTSFSDERSALSGQITRRDGTVIDYAVMPLPDGGTLLTFADITATKSYERALIERNDALVAADRLKSRFISHVSYELRTPLNTIIGFSQMLENPMFGTLNDKQREYLSDISVSSHTLLSIIDDILDLTTIDAGTMELKLEPVDVRAMIDTAISGVRDRASRARLTLDIALADDVGTLVADEARIRQSLYNLLSNAVGFSKPGDTIKISCWREAGEIVLEVADQGVGIPPEQIDAVFERFISDRRGSRHRGAGLGLPIVKSLVELHGGTIAIVSEPGAGTIVTMRLPESGPAAAASPDTATGAGTAERTASSAAGGSLPQLTA